MDYLELTVQLQPREPWAEVLICQLAENGFESFVDTEDGIVAYAQVGQIDVAKPESNTFLEDVPEELSVNWSQKIIAQQNWNAQWEADFQPVYVEEYLSILAPFHDRKTHKGMIVEILPKMSFGTGHHQTTWMMSKALFELDELPEKVLDMGTGTGVLAIIAEKLGAKDVLAVDIEDWSVENTEENAVRNACRKIRALCGDIDKIEEGDFGLILANINKNVLKAHMQGYYDRLNPNGKLFLSGFFLSDCDELTACAESFGFRKNSILNKDNWAAIEFKK
jgi:ribosomal protein L11 methyltransferase